MTTETIEAQVTALTLPERAAVALGAAKHEQELILLVAESKTITEIKNADARTQCHAAYMKLKNARVAIAATSKTAREDATAFSRAVIAEEKRLITITEAEETRLQQIRDQWDDAREAERQAKIKAEQERVAEIKRMIDDIRQAAIECAGKNATYIAGDLADMTAFVPGELYQEFQLEAVRVRDETIAKLTAMLADQQAKEAAEAKLKAEQEAEAARLKAEREELARLRAENEARRAAEEAKAKAAREAAEAELQAARDKYNAEVAAQRAELERQQQEVARQTAVLEAAQRQRDADAAAAKAAEEAEHRRMVEIERAEEAERALAAHAAGIAQDVAPRAAEALAEQPIYPPLDWPACPTPAAAIPPSLRLGQIGERLGFALSADFLRKLGFEPAEQSGRQVLYHERDFHTICTVLITLISDVRAAHRMPEAA